MISPFVMQALILADQADRRRDEARRERLARAERTSTPRFAGLRRLLRRAPAGEWPAAAWVPALRDDPYPAAGR